MTKTPKVCKKLEPYRNDNEAMGSENGGHPPIPIYENVLLHAVMMVGFFRFDQTCHIEKGLSHFFIFYFSLDPVGICDPSQGPSKT